MDDNANLIDDHHTVCLCDVGRPDYLAAVCVAADGTTHLILAERDSINVDTVRYDRTCAAVAHEQTGPLPIEFVRRITVSRRAHRCGRRTQAGTPCKIRVPRPGAACEWHREQPVLDLLGDS